MNEDTKYFFEKKIEICFNLLFNKYYIITKDVIQCVNEDNLFPVIHFSLC